MVSADMNFQRAGILVYPAALVTADLLALRVREHMVPHVILPLHPLVAGEAEEAIIGGDKEILPVGVAHSSPASTDTYNTRNKGASPARTTPKGSSHYLALSKTPSSAEL
jgi:hypothetical protein